MAITRAGDGRPEAGWTEYPTRTPTPVLIDEPPVIEPAPEDPWQHFASAPAPRKGEVRDALFYSDMPGFVVGTGDVPLALAAFGGPEHAHVLVGWCATSRTFQDASGTYVYDDSGSPYGDDLFPLPTFEVRNGARGTIQISWQRRDAVGGPIRTPDDKIPPRCPAALRYPKLPAKAADVHATIEEFRVVNGRYVVTTESASFCAPVSKSGCAADGWEEYELGTLPGDDLAGSYTWEGDFVVHGDRNGNLVAVRLPGARLVSRTDVGTSAVLGIVEEVTREDPLTLRLTVMAREDAKGTNDDIGKDDVVIRPDAAVFLGRGHTGLGRPRGDATTLRDYLRDAPDAGAMFWFVLDARGRAMRVVTHP